MVRIMDVAQVLNGIQVASNGSGDRLVFAVTDELCPWVGGTFELTETDGILAAQRVGGDAEIEMTIEGATALAYGTLPVEEIAHRQWFSGIDEKQVEILKRWFPVAHLFNLLEF